MVGSSESAQAADFAITILPEQFGWPKGSHVVLAPTKHSLALRMCQRRDTFQGKLPGFGWSAYEVTRK